MKLFVTGIAGRLGSAIVAEAKRQNIDIVGLDQKPWPADKPLPPQVKTHVGTYDDRDLVASLMDGCDGVIHTAGPNGDQVGKLGLDRFMHLNVTAVANLLEIAHAKKVRAVALSSTMEVQIGRDWSRSGMSVIDETYPANSDSVYSLSRRSAEIMAREFHNMTGLSVCSLRYMAFGYGKDENLGANLLARTVAAADIARINFLAATNPNLKGDVINVGPDTPLTQGDIIAAQADPGAVIERYWPGAMAIIQEHKARLRPDHFWPVTRIRLANTLLGWKPQITFTTWLTARGWTPAQPVSAVSLHP